MAEFIEKLSDIDLSDAKATFKLNATIIDIQTEGDPSTKRPVRFIAKVEHTGEIVTCISWDFNFLPVLRLAVKDMHVYELDGSASVFRDNLQLKISTIIKTETLSTRKVVQEEVEGNAIKAELEEIAKKYVKNIKLSSILNKALNIPELYLRPAACSIHHAYPGGLAKHTLNVTKTAINLYRNYSDILSLDLVVAGAMLHDIGKIYEYTNESQRTFEGLFMGHIPFGVSILTQIVNELGIDMFDPLIIQLFGIISSHHGKLEYGSPNTPNTLESLLIHFADHYDASMEAAREALLNIPEFGKTSPIFALENTAFVKLNNKELAKNE